MGLLLLFFVAACLIVILGTLGLIHTMQKPMRKTYAYALAHHWASDPDQLGLQAHEVTFDFHDHTQSPGWIIQGLKPNGPLLVMTHGWSASRYAILHKASLLTAYASQVVLYDLRGHGESTAKKSHLGITEADDLLEVIQQVNTENKPVVLHGTSMGAGIAIVAGAKDAGHLATKIVGVIAEGPYRQGLEPIIGHMRLKRICPYPFVWLAWGHVHFWTAKLNGFDRLEHAKKLKCPLLVLHGQLDPLCKLESAKQIANAVADSELVIFEGAGHGGLVQQDEKRYLDAVGRLIEKAMSIESV